MTDNTPVQAWTKSTASPNAAKIQEPTSPKNRRWLYVALSCGFLTLTAALLLHHADSIRDARDIALPMASLLPPLERRLQVLTQEVEMAQLQAQLRSGSEEERLRVHVLPAAPDVTRFLSFIDFTRDALQKRGLLRALSAVEASDPTSVMVGTTALQSRTLTFTATVNAEGKKQLLAMQRLTGLLTVADTLTPSQITKLFTLVDEKNPAYIVPVEQLLNADLYSYAHDPRPFDDRLSKALGTEEVILTFKKAFESQTLQDAKEVFSSDVGAALLDQKLWPLPFSTFDSLSLSGEKDGWMTVEMKIRIYGRES